MEAITAQAPSLREVIRSIRDARFANGVRCPRCDDHRVQRWGGFSGRQRYRCRGCGRTFSDLTGTAAAYIKRLPLWAPHAECLRVGLPVRRVASRIGIHPSTAFRWRHLLLDALRDGDGETVGGWVEIVSMRFPYSEKGSRKPRADHPPGSGTNVVIACDRLGYAVSAATEVSSGARLDPAEIDRVLTPRLRPKPVITSADGHFGPVCRFAARIGARYHDSRRSGHDLPPLLAHVRTAREYRTRLNRWMRRFRGVATRYLPNYLAWHCAFDRAFRHDLSRTLVMWPIGEWLPPSGTPRDPGPGRQQFSRTHGEAVASALSVPARSRDRRVPGGPSRHAAGSQRRVRRRRRDSRPSPGSWRAGISPRPPESSRRPGPSGSAPPGPS